jgi:hypothetical protein
MNRHLSIAALAAALALVPGCASLPFRLPFSRADGLERGISQEDLRTELAGYAARFAGTVETAADEISVAEPRRVRQRALLWRLRMIPAVQESTFLANPREGYLRALTIAVMQRRYLTVGDGRALFAEDQQIAVNAAQQLEQDALDIGSRFLTKAELERVAAEVDDLATRFPIQGTSFSLVRASQAVRQAKSNQTLGSLLTLPLAPFAALQGVDSGAAAIREFNQTARRFAGIVQRLPGQVRGEAELFLYDVEDRDTVEQGLAALKLVAASAERASLSIERLPADLQNALAVSQGPVVEARQTIVEAQALVPSLGDVAGKLREASLAWREMIGSRAERDADRSPDDEGGFDLAQVESAALALGGAAVELRGLAGDVDRLSASGGLADAVDRAFWRSATLLVLFFALLLGYRVLAARLVPRPRA